ncbi:MAG: hypothetical protein HC800_00235 [Phormidesmis sp. RL_2_1]|nr:hypothetical protein [Phormidesmis sp. RL_2_1]
MASPSALCIRHKLYPPYTAKYNPIEHRLFPHLSRVCKGVIFDSVEQVQALMAKASTKTGLKVFSSVIDAVYETGRKASNEFNQQRPISFDDFLPNWNYVARPQPS